MKKVNNLTKYGSGNTQEFFNDLVKKLNDNFQEIATETGLTLEDDDPWTPEEEGDEDADV